MELAFKLSFKVEEHFHEDVSEWNMRFFIPYYEIVKKYMRIVCVSLHFHHTLFGFPHF